MYGVPVNIVSCHPVLDSMVEHASAIEGARKRMEQETLRRRIAEDRERLGLCLVPRCYDMRKPDTLLCRTHGSEPCPPS